MPKRLPWSSSRLFGNLFGNLFVFIVLMFMSFQYWVYVALAHQWFQKTDDTWEMSKLAIFHLLLFMILWCFFQVMTTDPGQVPPYWGFHMGDPEHKRRRYCLMCHVFKPERCHHCSACNRCVLNMDHHCPWINNCVGFMNRKYFLLLVGYVLITAWFISLTLFPYAKEAGIFFYDMGTDAALYPNFIILLGYTLITILGVVLFFFFKFHIGLVLKNSTTIENMSKELDPSSNGGIYDVGGYHNWRQVFGKNVYMWFFPFCGQSGKPVGDGVVWPQKHREEQLESTMERQKESHSAATSHVETVITNNKNQSLGDRAVDPSDGSRTTPLLAGSVGSANRRKNRFLTDGEDSHRDDEHSNERNEQLRKVEGSDAIRLPETKPGMLNHEEEEPQLA